MTHLRKHTWFYLAVVLFVLWPAAMPTTAAQAAVNDTWIAFTSLAPGEEGIWRVHPDGSGLGQLTEGRDLYPTWSPDGSLLAYVHETSGTLLYGNIQGYTSEIRVVDTAGQIRYTIGRDTWVAGEAATPLPGSVGLPQWSPDGQALSYGVDVQYFVVVAWGGRRTFYLSPPRIEVGRGPQGTLLTEGTVLLDQAWGPGPVPTWVQTGADLAGSQVMPYDRTLINTATDLFLNPRWAPAGQHLTIYRQSTQQEQFSNALLQVNLSGDIERTLFESADLYLYTIAEPSPDGQEHLIGISADASSWFPEALAGMFQEPGKVSILPLEPPPSGYLYVLDQAGAKTVVAQPQRGTVDLVSRQPWSPDGAQVVFMRAPHPSTEGTTTAGLGIYVGAPGQTSRLVPFSAAELSFELTIAYPAWQPAPQGTLPTMVPLATAGPPPTEVPSPGPATPVPTATATPKPTQLAPLTATAGPSPQPTPTPTPAPPPPRQSGLRAALLIGIGLMVLVLVGMIAWMLLRPEGATIRWPAFLTRLFQPRQQDGEPASKNSFRALLRRLAPRAKDKPGASGSLLLRPAPAAGEAAPKKRWTLFKPRPKATAGEAVAKKRRSLWTRRPKAAPPTAAESAAAAAPAPTAPGAAGDGAPETLFPSLHTRQEGAAEWPTADHRSIPPEAPADSQIEPAGTPTSPTPITGEVVSGPEGQAPSPEQELLRQGIAQVRAGKVAAGMVLLQKVVQTSPDVGEAWLWLGWAAARQNQRILAERCFRRARELGWGEQAEQALAWLRKK